MKLSFRAVCNAVTFTAVFLSVFSWRVIEERSLIGSTMQYGQYSSQDSMQYGEYSTQNSQQSNSKTNPSYGNSYSESPEPSWTDDQPSYVPSSDGSMESQYQNSMQEQQTSTQQYSPDEYEYPEPTSLPDQWYEEESRPYEPQPMENLWKEMSDPETPSHTAPTEQPWPSPESTSEQTYVAPSTFSDVSPQYQYKKEIETVVEMGFFSGNPDGTFNPDASINRAEFAAIMTKDASDEYRAYCKAIPSSYNDVAEDAWYKEATCLAKEMGIMQGMDDGSSFGPAENVNLAQAAKIIAIKFNLPVPHTGGTEWYSDYVSAIEERGAIPPTVHTVAIMITRGESTYLIQKVSAGLAQVGEPVSSAPRAPIFAPTPTPSSAQAE
ncbi:MAG: S-layer homology domain-containing protein [Candidatus Peregrinibacteria bacterium]|nr:S-layer homology domain-containing protein [Candidatus Peregrinibacteria bacterium]